MKTPRRQFPPNQLLIKALVLLGLFFFVWRSHEPFPKSLGPKAKVEVNLYVMSKCPDAVYCEGVMFQLCIMINIDEKIGRIMNIHLDYIASSPSSCKHGLEECIGNMQQLCVHHMFSEPTWLKFIQCQNENYRAIPDNAQHCYETVTTGDYSDLEHCVEHYGAQYLNKSIARQKESKTVYSCSITLNHASSAVYNNGQWETCLGGDCSVDGFKRRICDLYQDQKPECL